MLTVIEKFNGSTGFLAIGQLHEDLHFGITNGTISIDPNVQDVEDMLRVKEGDVPSFEALVARHKSSVIDPYQTPASSLDDTAHRNSSTVDAEEWSLASRWQRLGAWYIDFVFIGLASMIDLHTIS